MERADTLALMMQSIRHAVGESDMLAYLTMMAPRLVELHRVLKPTGTIWLHCDPTASHYLKVILDTIFGPRRFLNEVIWKRSSAHSDTKQGMARCGKIHDTILVYTKTEEYTWNPQYTAYTGDYLESEYRHVHGGRRFKETDLTAAKPGGDVEYDWHVKRPISDEKMKPRWQPDLEEEFKNPRDGIEYLAVRPYNGRYWAYSKDNLIAFARDGKLIHRETGMPRLMQFADEMPGVALQDLWDDIPPESGKRDLGYPTQKPQPLLERIVAASTNPGDVVLDPFCGCGTAIAASQQMGREWHGIDVTHLAISLIRYRLADSFGAVSFEVVGEPYSVPDAKALSIADRFQFQWWAVGKVGAKAVERKKGADKGIDGRLLFHDDAENQIGKQVILSVKSGENVSVADVRDLCAVVNREKAAIGVLILLEGSTKPMRVEAAKAGDYESPWGTKHAKIQILTIEELLDGAKVDMPPSRDMRTFKKAPKATPNKTKQQKNLF